MFKITDSEGEVFFLDSFSEIQEFFGELTMAVGAEDVKMTIEYAKE
jgi:hypothetical protein